MNIKNSNESLKLSYLFPVMYASTLILVILRCLQLTKFIDSETGFLTGGSVVNAFFCCIAFISCFVFCVGSFLSVEGKKVELVGLKDKKAGIASVLFAIGLLYDWLNSFFDSIVLLEEMDTFVVSKADMFKSLMSSGVLPYLMQSFFAVFSAVYLIVLAKSFIKGSKAAHNHKLMALFPIGWAAFKLITRFIKQISYIKISDLFFELVMISFMILFFVALSQVISGVYCDVSRWRITALGLSGALISFAINLPRLILTIFASDSVNKEYPFSLADTMFAVFAVAISVAAYKSVKQADSHTTE